LKPLTGADTISGPALQAPTLSKVHTRTNDFPIIMELTLTNPEHNFRKKNACIAAAQQNIFLTMLLNINIPSAPPYSSGSYRDRQKTLFFSKIHT
jgi:hypothetical protein